MKYLMSVMFVMALAVSAQAGETAVIDEPVVEPVAAVAAVADDCCCEGVIAKVVKAPFRMVGRVAECMKQRRCCKPCEVKVVEVACVKRCRPRPRLCLQRVKLVRVDRCCKQ